MKIRSCQTSKLGPDLSCVSVLSSGMSAGLSGSLEPLLRAAPDAVGNGGAV